MEEITDTLFRARENALKEMISDAECEITKITSPYNNTFFDNSFIVSFNYTSTLESLFALNNSEILHIHGDFTQDDELIFGYKDEAVDLLETNESINKSFE